MTEPDSREAWDAILREYYSLSAQLDIQTDINELRRINARMKEIEDLFRTHGVML